MRFSPALTFSTFSPRPFTVNATLMLIVGLRVFDQVLALTGGGPAGASETLATEVYKQTFIFGRYGVRRSIRAAVVGLDRRPRRHAAHAFSGMREARI